MGLSKVSHLFDLRSSKGACTPPRCRRVQCGGVKGQAFSIAAATAAAAAAAAWRLPPNVSTRGKLSGRAKSVRVHVGGNRFLVFSRFCNRLPSAALPSLK